jgi:hypothetical protein
MTCDTSVRLPTPNVARFHHLRRLARDAEREGRRRYGTKLGLKYFKLASAYWDMASRAMPGGDLQVHTALIDKLRLMTVENECTPPEAKAAAQMVLKLEGGANE